MDKRYLIITYLNSLQEQALKDLLTEPVYESLAEEARLAEIAREQVEFEAKMTNLGAE